MPSPNEQIAYRPLLRLSLYGADETLHSMLQFSRFLYEFNLLYEVCRLVTDPRYKEFQFPQYTFHRQKSPLDPHHRLLVDRIRQESPWQIAVSALADPQMIAAAAGLLTWLGKGVFIGTAYSWLLDQEKKRIELKKSKQDLRKGEVEIEKSNLELEKVRHEIETLKLGNEEKRRALIVPEPPSIIEMPSRMALEMVGAEVDPRALQRKLDQRRATKFAERSAHILESLDFKSDKVEAEFVVRTKDHEIR